MLSPLLLREVSQQQRQLDVLGRGQHREQIVELENEADMGRPPRRDHGPRGALFRHTRNDQCRILIALIIGSVVDDVPVLGWSKNFDSSLIIKDRKLL